MDSTKLKSILAFIGERLKEEKSFEIRQDIFMAKFELPLDYQLKLIGTQDWKLTPDFKLTFKNQSAGDADTVLLVFERP